MSVVFFNHIPLAFIYAFLSFPKQEQMDMKVLQFQNKKLVERIDQRKRAEEELHKRIEQLENRQRTDDAVLMIVNRYWNQVQGSLGTIKASQLVVLNKDM